MSDNTSASDLEERKLRLEEREADRADRQLELDHRWVKVWAPVLIPGMITLGGVIFGGMVTFTTNIAQTQQTQRENYLQNQETIRQNDTTDHVKAIEVTRAAAEMYFDKLSDLKKIATLTDIEQNLLLDDLQIISVLGDNPAFSKVLSDEKQVVVTTHHNNAISNFNSSSSATPGQSVPSGGGSQLAYIASPALQGLPDVTPVDPSGHYTASAFLAFPQVPGTNDPYEQQFVDGLVSLGFKVQPTQHMAAGKSPPDNEIRYYRADQATFAGQIATHLKQESGLTFNAVQLHTPGLPNGVMEFWLGQDTVNSQN